MAGYESRDKKIAGNRQLVESHDHAQGKKSMHEGKEDGKAKKKAGGADEESSHSPIHEVVAEHGPAHTHIVTAHRDGGHDGMTHHSETHHESGHVHHADHGSLEEAHSHGMAAMLGNDGEHNEMEPDDAEVAEEGAEEQMSHGKTEHVGFMR